MPVVTLQLERLMKMLKGFATLDEIIEAIPYLGLDIEDVGEGFIKVEYNPNRPDFSSDYGIARALNGLLGFELGCPEPELKESGFEVYVDKSIAKVRPYIVCLVTKEVELDDEAVRQLITMQEDIHNGIGRRRKKVSIGIHNLDVIKPPISYTTVEPSFSFVPLGEAEPMSMGEVLERLDVGREYGGIVSKFERLPILLDSSHQVLSFPPIINAELTRVTSKTRNLFIDVTATDLKAAEDALAILSFALKDAGGSLETLKICYPDHTMVTPDLEPITMNFDLNLAKRLLGLDLSPKDVVSCLEKCRLSASFDEGRVKVKIPRYRSDIIHEVDLVEEVAIGYGLKNFSPTIPATTSVGRLKEEQKILSRVRETLTSLGLIEVMGFSLASKNILFDHVNRKLPREALKVMSPKTSEHEYLRDLLLPTLLSTLSKNVRQEYPQRIFEVAKTFHLDLDSPTGIREEYHVAVAIAHSTASFTEAKSYLEALLCQAFSLSATTLPVEHFIFSKGRGAEVKVFGEAIGVVGEVRPRVLESFKLRTPVSAFELNLEGLMKQKAQIV